MQPEKDLLSKSTSRKGATFAAGNQAEAGAATVGKKGADKVFKENRQREHWCFN
jgi:hypothetical protein